MMKAIVQQNCDMVTIRGEFQGLLTPGISVKKSNRSLVRRLVQAVEADAAFTKPTVLKDAAGKDFVSVQINVLGRYLSADLKKLGF
jgi:hypothetical protein